MAPTNPDVEPNRDIGSLLVVGAMIEQVDWNYKGVKINGPIAKQELAMFTVYGISTDVYVRIFAVTVNNFYAAL